MELPSSGLSGSGGAEAGGQGSVRFSAHSPRAGSFSGSRRDTQRDPSDPLCRGLKGKEPRAPRGLARGKPEGGRRAAAPYEVGVREGIKRRGVG